MPLWKPEKLEITAEDVIRGQGADPEVVRVRRPQLFDIAAEAIELGRGCLSPRVLYREFRVEGLRHEKLSLANGAALSGELIAGHLARAEKALILIGTVGAEIDEAAAQTMAENPLLGLALDGLGAAAVEELINQACAMFEAEAARQGLHTTVPLSPGMLGWDVGLGQPEIFKAMPADEIGVQLNDSAVMLPKKSLSLVLGIGKELGINGIVCDFCMMAETCSYRSHYPAE